MTPSVQQTNQSTEGLLVKSAKSNGESGNVHENQNFKVYNFRRPDKFSKEQLRGLQSIHESFAHQCALSFSSYLRMSVEMDVLSVDQLTYDEFVRSMPTILTVNILELSPLPGQVLMGVSHEITTLLIDRLLGGTGKSELDARTLTDIEHMLLKRFFQQTYTALEEAWENFCPLNVKLIGTEDNYSLVHVATPSEIVALITFEIVFGQRESGLMSLCIPFPVLEGIISRLNAQHMMHLKNTTTYVENKAEILESLNEAKIPVDVQLGKVVLPVMDLLQTEVGDVLPMKGKITDELIIRINTVPKFYGKPGTSGRQLATYLTRPIHPVELLEDDSFEDLSYAQLENSESIEAGHLSFLESDSDDMSGGLLNE